MFIFLSSRPIRGDGDDGDALNRIGKVIRVCEKWLAGRSKIDRLLAVRALEW